MMDMEYYLLGGFVINMVLLIGIYINRREIIRMEERLEEKYKEYRESYNATIRKLEEDLNKIKGK